MRIKIQLIMLWAVLFFTACQKENLTGIVEDDFFLRVDGQSMPVKVAGNVSSNKLLILLHGGPGTGVTYFKHNYVKEHVQKEFAVVYWDQRLAGLTQGNHADYKLENYRNDLKKLIQLLKSKYGNEKKIYLLGHSWGGFLAPYFLINHQEMVDGWIQVDGAHNLNKLDSLTHQMLLNYGKQEVTANRNVTKWQEIVDYCENNSVENASTFQLNKYAHAAEKLIQEVHQRDFSLMALYTDNNADGSAFFSNAFLSPANKEIWNSLKNENISNDLHKITVPTLLLWGKYDFVCPLGLKSDIQENISSTDVSEMIFEQSAHSPMFNQPILFWDEITKWVNQH